MEIFLNILQYKEYLLFGIVYFIGYILYHACLC